MPNITIIRKGMILYIYNGISVELVNRFTALGYMVVIKGAL